MFYFQQLLISWVGTDNCAPQSDPEFNNYTSNNSINSDRISKLLFEEDNRLLTIGSARPRSPSIERYKHVIEMEPSPPPPDPAPAVSEGDFIKPCLGSSKKYKKRSKISAVQAVFKED